MPICLAICLGLWLIMAIEADQTRSTYQHTASLNAKPATFLDAYGVAYHTISQWNSNSYLHYASWIAPCADPYALPSRTMFNFISKQRRFLSEQTWVARVWVDLSSQVIETSATDLTTAGPPDSQTYPEQLDVEYKDAITIAFTTGGDDYMAVNSNCVVRIWLQDDTWRFNFDPNLYEYKEDLVVLVNGRSGDVSVISGD